MEREKEMKKQCLFLIILLVVLINGGNVSAETKQISETMSLDMEQSLEKNLLTVEGGVNQEYIFTLSKSGLYFVKAKKDLIEDCDLSIYSSNGECILNNSIFEGDTEEVDLGLIRLEAGQQYKLNILGYWPEGTEANVYLGLEALQDIEDISLTSKPRTNYITGLERQSDEWDVQLLDGAEITILFKDGSTQVLKKINGVADTYRDFYKFGFYGKAVDEIDWDKSGSYQVKIVSQILQIELPFELELMPLEAAENSMIHMNLGEKKQVPVNSYKSPVYTKINFPNDNVPYEDGYLIETQLEKNEYMVVCDPDGGYTTYYPTDGEEKTAVHIDNLLGETQYVSICSNTQSNSDRTTSLSVKQASKIKGWTISSLPEKTEYYPYEMDTEYSNNQIDYTGLTIAIEYNSGEILKAVYDSALWYTQGFNLEEPETFTSEAGKKAVIVSNGDSKESFDIIVKPFDNGLGNSLYQGEMQKIEAEEISERHKVFSFTPNTTAQYKFVTEGAKKYISIVIWDSDGGIIAFKETEQYTDCDVTLTQQLTAGITYYYTVYSRNENVSDFNVMITGDGSAVHIHSYKKTEIPADCIHAAKNKYVCKCGDIKEEIVSEALGHAYGEWKIIKKASCKEEGEQIQVCSRCKEEKKQKLSLSAHKMGGFVIDKEASCTEEGEKSRYCSICGMRSDRTTIPKLAHQYGDWVIQTAPTALEEGVEQRQCSICGNKEQKTNEILKPFIKLNVKSIPLKVKQKTSAIKVTMQKGDKVVSWKSNKPKIASVNKKGVITGKKAGTAKITVTLASKKKAVLTVKVQKKAVKTTKIVLNKKVLVLEKGKTFTLKATVTPITSLEKIVYATSNKKIITVSKRGVIKAAKKGTAKIIVKSGKKKAVCTVKVK